MYFCYCCYHYRCHRHYHYHHLHLHHYRFIIVNTITNDLLRLLQKRFVVYEPSKAAPHPTAAPGQPQSGREQIMETSSCHQPGTAKGTIVLYIWKNLPSVAVAAVVNAMPQPA